MIAGIFHEGSGIGNQLFRYVATRVLAEDKGYEWTMLGGNNFKGNEFISMPLLPWIDEKSSHRWNEKKIIENGIDIRGYDPEINFVEDNTIIDGEFQDSRYFEHRINEVREWLKVEPLDIPDDICVIGFRGGEYKVFPDLYLPTGYYQKAISLMQEKYPNIRFEIHTDDTEEANRFLNYLGCPIIHDVGRNWRSVRYAKHLILANSSFYILPALLNQNVQEIIAPRYWARHNTKVWALPQNYYKQFQYI